MLAAFTTATDLSAYLAPAAGGALVGASAVLLMLVLGRVAGVSGIVGGALFGLPTERSWRMAFIGGALAAGLCLRVAAPQVYAAPAAGTVTLIIGGLLVGFGTRLGGGCTSGHGVCGLGRRSPRSLAATLTFIGVAAAVVYVTRHVLGAAS